MGSFSGPVRMQNGTVAKTRNSTTSIVDTTPAQSAPTVSAGRALRFNALLALLVWAGWGIFGGATAWHSLLTHWQVALTMVFGSLVGGGTSEGGAAVAFPVFTKVLHIPAADARLFSFAVQSIGMGAASISILYQRIPIERRVLGWAGLSGITGMVVSTYLLVPHAPGPIVRVTFTAMVTSLGVVLLATERHARAHRNPTMPLFGGYEKTLLCLAGFVGGLFSGLIGCGENIVLFMVLVVLFRVNEKVVTPTTVILMTMVTWSAFFLHYFVVQDFPSRVVHYWQAAVPVAVVTAPLGAFLCARIPRRAIVLTLVVLIAVELGSTLYLIDMSHGVGLAGLIALAFFGVLNWLMARSRRYLQVPLA